MGEDISALRDGIDSLTFRSALNCWGAKAVKAAIDPF
jgi:hypothetical protein